MVPSHVGVNDNKMDDYKTVLATRTIPHPTITEIPINSILKHLPNK